MNDMEKRNNGHWWAPVWLRCVHCGVDMWKADKTKPCAGKPKEGAKP